jgi:hypothetical protein
MKLQNPLFLPEKSSTPTLEAPKYDYFLEVTLYELTRNNK